MKVGIIGLQPRQIQSVQKREYNGHTVEFYNEKTYTQEKIASFVRKMDKVIHLPGHTPKRLDEWIPKTKLHSMFGGMSSVVSYLSTLPPDTVEEPVRPLGTPKQQPTFAQLGQPKPRVEPEAEPVIEVKPPKKLGATIPKGRTSQYTWSADIGIVHPNESGEHRYDLLDAAVPGDVLRLARPKGVDYQVWRTRITSTRYAREKAKGQILEAHYFEEYVDLLVVDPDPKTTATEQAETGTHHEPESTAPAAEASIPKPQGEVDDSGKTIVLDRGPKSSAPVEEAPAPIHPASVPGPAAIAIPDLERDFWMQVFLRYADRLAPQQCAEFADSAVRELNQRYKK